MRIAIDTGGTFTDCVAIVRGDLKVFKLPSTPADPSRAVLEGVQQLGGLPETGLRDVLDIRHGTTVGTNTMLERTGARVAFVTTAGFEDTIAIGRQARSKLYDWFAPVPVCLVPKELRFGVEERVSAEGRILRRPSDEELASLVEKVRASGAEAIAISLLFGFANPETERRVEVALQSLGVPVSAAHRILPEFREYERGSTTVVNAYLAPRMGRYLNQLDEGVEVSDAGNRVHVMQSSGGIISARLAAKEPVRTVLSGPAGGVVGACRVARWAGFERIIGFDMGGTSTDVFLADAACGDARLTRESIVAGVPIGVSMLDIHTAGAGGGSIARFDAGGMLRVGPQSAGAEPGPICFGRGCKPTVTDANFLLGRLDPESFLGGSQLDRERTERIFAEQKGPIETTEKFAAGILRVVEAEMEKAIRVISIDRGYDPRDFVLVAFGGGGPLHACSLARALRISKVLIPVVPGALSALGILLADRVRDSSRTVMLPEDSAGRLERHFEDLEYQARQEFLEGGLEGVAQRALDIRYRGQGYELSVPLPGKDLQTGKDLPIAEGFQCAVDAFHRLHHKNFGFFDKKRPLEIVSVRVRMTVAGEPYEPPRHAPVAGDGRAACYAERRIFFGDDWLDSRLYRRSRLSAGDIVYGPAMITEYTAATVLHPGDRAELDSIGNLIVFIDPERG